jgi:hypothetical protein
MLTTKDRRPAFRTIEGWARSVLLEAGTIRECEEHGWMKDRADPYARRPILRYWLLRRWWSWPRDCHSADLAFTWQTLTKRRPASR